MSLKKTLLYSFSLFLTAISFAQQSYPLYTADIEAQKVPKIDKAKLAGASVAKKALALNITTCVFDRGGSLYHGRIKAVAEGARAGGLQF